MEPVREETEGAELPPQQASEEPTEILEEPPFEEPESVVYQEIQISEEERGRGVRRKKGLGAWVSSRAKKVVHSLYDSRADDIEERARRAVGSAYRDSADDLQNRAVEAMREAIRAESERIKEAIEHSVDVKKREARLSLLVLVVASLVYLLLYWATHSGGAGS